MTQANPINSEAFEIRTEALDPIHVYWTDFNQHAGMVTIVCWGTARSAYFNAMGGDRTIRQFFSRCDVDYLTTKLSTKKGEYRQWVRIVEAVKRSLCPENQVDA